MFMQGIVVGMDISHILIDRELMTNIDKLQIVIGHGLALYF